MHNLDFKFTDIEEKIIDSLMIEKHYSAEEAEFFIKITRLVTFLLMQENYDIIYLSSVYADMCFELVDKVKTYYKAYVNCKPFDIQFKLGDEIKQYSVDNTYLN